MQLMDSNQLAEYLCLSIRTIKTYRARKPDKLPPSFMLNGQYRWDKAQVDAWLERKKKEVRDDYRD